MDKLDKFKSCFGNPIKGVQIIPQKKIIDQRGKIMHMMKSTDEYFKGFGEILNNIKYIYTEVNTASVYKDCALVGELDEYLSRYGFSRVETKMTPFEWGDAFYIK